MTSFIPKILIVDDLPQNLFLLEAVLKKEAVSVVKAKSGKEALEKLRDNIFSLALLDVLMPEMDGFELAERIRKDENHRLLPIIFVSANYLDDVSIFKGYQAGAVDYITKPFNRDILLSKVRIFTELACQKEEILEQNERMEILLTDQIDSQKTIAEQLLLEQAYSKVTSFFVGDFELEKSLQQALEVIGNLIRATGAFFYNYKPIPNTFEVGVFWHQDTCNLDKEKLSKIFDEELATHLPNLRAKVIIKKEAEVLAPSIDFILVPIHVFNELRAIMFFCNEEYSLQFFDKFRRLGLFTDLISSALERMEVQKKLQHTERLAGIGEIAAGIAHELNQPLNTISLGIDNLLLAVKSGKATEEYLNKKSKKIFDNILRTRSIIDHVRTFSRDQDGYINSEFNLNDSIKNAISLISEQYVNHGISIILNLEENLPKPIGNTYKFEEVILNFLSNAMHAVGSRKESEGMNYFGEITIHSYQQNDKIVVDVTDNGCGIPEHILSKIMQPFFTTKEEGKGTGLGLSIAFGIIKDMNGSIDFTSTVGSGTKVQVALTMNKKFAQQQQKKE